MDTENTLETLEAAPTKPLKRDSKLVADEHDGAVLEALHRFGWLPTRDLSALIWPQHEGTTCAKRSLARLRKAGYIAQNATTVTRGRGNAVIADRAPDGAVISVLTEAGAAFLRANRGIPAVSAEHLLAGFANTYRHRCLSNEFVINWLKKNGATSGTICTEYEITMRRSVLDRKDGSAGAKIADAYIIEPASEAWSETQRNKARRNGWKYTLQRWATWIEVENSYKKQSEQLKLGRELCSLLGDGRSYPTSRDDVVIHSALVLCPDELTERRLVKTVLDCAFAPAADRFSYLEILAGVSVWRVGSEEKSLAAYIKADCELSERHGQLLQARMTRGRDKR